MLNENKLQQVNTVFAAHHRLDFRKLWAFIKPLYNSNYVYYHDTDPCKQVLYIVYVFCQNQLKCFNFKKKLKKHYINCISVKKLTRAFTYCNNQSHSLNIGRN